MKKSRESLLKPLTEEIQRPLSCGPVSLTNVGGAYKMLRIKSPWRDPQEEEGTRGYCRCCGAKLWDDVEYCPDCEEEFG